MTLYFVLAGLFVITWIVIITAQTDMPTDTSFGRQPNCSRYDHATLDIQLEMCQLDNSNLRRRLTQYQEQEVINEYNRGHKSLEEYFAELMKECKPDLPKELKINDKTYKSK